MKTNSHRFLCALCALTVFISALFPASAFAAQAADTVAQTTLTTADAQEMQQADSAVTALTGSDALIYRLLFNLTENAVKYNRPGGSVRVELAQGQEKCIIRVSDTGCGIPEEYQRSIFHPFFRVDKSRSREYGGAGLGLSLVWEIANLHGGSVWVEESSDKGTTIAVELPAGAENDSSGADIP